MTCLEAQSKIIAYIDYKLEKDEKQEFLRHIQHCQDCREELDIYYTMIEGMRQLDNNLPLSIDFTKALDNRMQRELANTRKKQDFFRASVVLTVAAILGFGIFGYVNFLNLLHQQEQDAIKEAQGEYYYSETFDGYLFEPEGESRTRDINVSGEKEQPTFYERIREYNVLSRWENES